MKRYLVILSVLFLILAISACGNNTKNGEKNSTIQNVGITHSDISLETEIEAEPEDMEETEEDAVANQVYMKVGESTLTVILENNESAEALKELLADGSLTISCSNYGGFEKVCSLGTELPRNDRQITTKAGDVCLYNGNQIVIFYGSNSWAYTRFGKISDMDESELEQVLSGEETEITISIEQSH